MRRATLQQELTEQFLYFHLEVARKARLWMDSARTWSTEYNAKYRERELAIAAAVRHYHALERLGEIPPDLDRMAMVEGLRP